MAQWRMYFSTLHFHKRHSKRIFRGLEISSNSGQGWFINYPCKFGRYCETSWARIQRFLCSFRLCWYYIYRCEENRSFDERYRWWNCWIFQVVALSAKKSAVSKPGLRYASRLTNSVVILSSPWFLYYTQMDMSMSSRWRMYLKFNEKL